MIVTRFAPSPNGHLHLGHAYSAIAAHDRAVDGGGKFLLRIEDIDGERSRPELADEFRMDIEWLGLSFEEVTQQSLRVERYQAAAERLKTLGLLFPCLCTRSQIADAATKEGPEGPIYPGTCRGRSDLADVDAKKEDVAWRLDMQAATKAAGELHWMDELAGQQTCRAADFGDVVLIRKDAPASYHLAATLDDAADEITHVTRGMDLFGASHIHRLLQALLGLPVPVWHHHQLLVDGNGEKLAKRKLSASLSDRRLAGEDGRELAEKLRLNQLPAGISFSQH